MIKDIVQTVMIILGLFIVAVHCPIYVESNVFFNKHIVWSAIGAALLFMAMDWRYKK